MRVSGKAVIFLAAVLVCGLVIYGLMLYIWNEGGDGKNKGVEIVFNGSSFPELWSLVLEHAHFQNETANLSYLYARLNKRGIELVALEFYSGSYIYHADFYFTKKKAKIYYLPAKGVNQKKTLHPLYVLSALDKLKDEINVNSSIMAGAQWGDLEFDDKVSDLYAVKDDTLIPLRKISFYPEDPVVPVWICNVAETGNSISTALRMKEIGTGCRVFFLWQDVVSAAHIEPEFTVEVFDAYGKPVANATVELAEMCKSDCKQFESKTDDRGRAVFTDPALLRVFDTPFVGTARKGNNTKFFQVYKSWNARVAFTKEVENLENLFEVKLEADKYLLKEGEVINFYPSLIYHGNFNTEIYFGHIHPFRVEIRNESGVVAKLPEITLSILAGKEIGSGSKTEFPVNDLSFRFMHKGIYEVVAYAEISSNHSSGEWIRIYSNPVIVEVVR